MFVQTLYYILRCKYAFRQGRTSQGSRSSKESEEKEEDVSQKKKSFDAGPPQFFENDSDDDSQAEKGTDSTEEEPYPINRSEK